MNSSGRGGGGRKRGELASSGLDSVKKNVS